MASRWFLLLCGAALAVTQALAQTPANKRPIHIDGTLLEKESRAPIPGAKVTLAATENSDELNTTSDANGRFSFNTIEPFEMGLPLQIRASAPGYVVALPDVGGSSLGQMIQGMGQGVVFITRDKSTYAIEVNLSKVATLSGVLIDQETKKPIAKLTVSAQRRIYRDGEPVFSFGGGTPVTTAADGSFHFESLNGGDYILQVQDPLKPKIEAVPAGPLPAPPDSALGYGVVFLPGATAELPVFASIPVRAGATVDLGQLSLRQQRLHNFVGTIDSDCRDSERVNVYLDTPRNTRGPVYGPRSAEQVVPCGLFRILNVPEDAFVVGLRVLGGRGEGYVSQPLELRAADPIHLRVQPRGTVQGVLEAEEAPADQFPKDLEGLLVAFNPKSVPNFAEDLSRTPSVNGHFEGFLYGAASYELQFGRFPETYYVKHLFYNGVEQPDPLRFTTTPGVVTHSVRIVLSPHPATFQAQVDPGSTVFLIPDGVAPDRRYAERIVLNTGPQQKGVRKSGLRPGAYHAFALPASALSALELPGGMEQALFKAQAVKLEEGQTATVSFVPQ